MIKASTTRLRRAAMRVGWLAALATTAVPAARADTLDEIVVTARKTEESAQTVPLSVQVLSAELLATLDLTRLFDLQFNVLGLVVNNLGVNGAGFALRGVADQGGSSLSVASHLNGIYLGTSNLAITRLFDLERVEVLKGPQGTLYGRNSTGGSINFVTHAPENDFGAHIEAAHGSFDTTRVQGHVNLPFGRSALRLAYIASEGNGSIRNSVDQRRFAEEDYHGLRASLRFQVNERLRLDAVAQQVVDDGASNELWLPNPSHLVDPGDIRLTTVTLANPVLKTVNDNADVRIEYELGFATLRSLTGYASSKLRDRDDCAGMPFLAGCVRSALPSRHRQWSQELQLASTPGKTVDWLLGAYVYSGDAWRNYFQRTPVFDPEPSNDHRAAESELTRAVFAQASWQAGDALSITAGLRLNAETHDFETVGSGTDDSPTLVKTSKDWHNDSWRLDAAWTPAQDVLVYASVATGFKSGGSEFADGIIDDYDPEHLLAYETGAKILWLDGRAVFNAAAFYYDFRDLQLLTSTLTPDGLIFETDNAARVEIYGIDAEARYRASPRLNVSGGVVWLPRREFVRYRNDRTGDTLSGNEVARAPEWTAVAAVDYEHPLGRLGTLATRLEYNYRSGFFYTTDNNPQFSQDDFGLLNLFLRFEPANRDWYVFVSGRNLGDANYFNQVFLQSSPGYPDTYEAGFGYRF